MLASLATIMKEKTALVTSMVYFALTNNTCTVDFLTGTIKIYPMLLEAPLVCSSHEAHSL